MVTASTELLIGDANGEHVLIAVLSRNHPGFFDYWDGNWVGCALEISAGGFRGAFRADLRSEEFRAFLDEAEALTRVLDGVATFSTMEEQIRVTLTCDGKGHVRVQGEARDAAGSPNRLHFCFDIDQTYLPQICGSLEVILAAFPVLGTVSDP
jgi:hypothetical protein